MKKKQSKNGDIGSTAGRRAYRKIKKRLKNTYGGESQLILGVHLQVTAGLE